MITSRNPLFGGALTGRLVGGAACGALLASFLGGKCSAPPGFAVDESGIESVPGQSVSPAVVDLEFNRGVYNFDSPFRMRDFLNEGHAVLAYTWATWCVYCPQKFPVLNQIQHDYGPQGLIVVAVATDSLSKLAPVVVSGSHQGLQVPVAVAPPGWQKAIGSNELPSAIIFAPNGEMYPVDVGRADIGTIISSVLPAGASPVVVRRGTYDAVFGEFMLQHELTQPENIRPDASRPYSLIDFNNWIGTFPKNFCKIGDFAKFSDFYRMNLPTDKWKGDVETRARVWEVFSFFLKDSPDVQKDPKIGLELVSQLRSEPSPKVQTQLVYLIRLWAGYSQPPRDVLESIEPTLVGLLSREPAPSSFPMASLTVEVERALAALHGETDLEKSVLPGLRTRFESSAPDSFTEELLRWHGQMVRLEGSALREFIKNQLQDPLGAYSGGEDWQDRVFRLFTALQAAQRTLDDEGASRAATKWQHELGTICVEWYVLNAGKDSELDRAILDLLQTIGVENIGGADSANGRLLHELSEEIGQRKTHARWAARGLQLALSREGVFGE